ncbi:MAG TPA: hypothetical protein VM103_00235 [Candidatus Paceibacterota bacterium]|nr:hypothetical protein [Candidatus Paceibacterota bacterium]
MNSAKVLEAVAQLRQMVTAQCERYLTEVVIPARMNPALEHASDATWLAHVLYMCDEISKFINEDRLGKAMRWLGFAQGVLSARFGVTIQAMKELNMPFPDRLPQETGTG